MGTRLPGSPVELAGKIDHTLLKPEASMEKYENELRLTSSMGFRAFVAPLPVLEQLVDTSSYTRVRIATVVGFPNGYYTLESKLKEIEKAASIKVSDVDFVLNLVNIKSSRWNRVEDELKKIITLAKDFGMTTKLILETGYLTEEELRKVGTMAVDFDVDFLKTSTGFGPRGATVDDILLLKEIAAGRAGVKASGGIRTTLQALLFILLGADIIGTSNGLHIVKGFNKGLAELLRERMKIE